MRFNELSDQILAGAHVRRDGWAVGDYVSKTPLSSGTSPHYHYWTGANAVFSTWTPSDDDLQSEDWQIEC